MIRSLESRLCSTVGATGAIYAIRRELLSKLRPDTILDDVVIPMRTVMAGKRTVFEPEAKAFDVVSCCPTAEYQRKVRTLAGNYQLLTLMPELLSPFRNPVWWQFMSHKIGRLVMPYALLALFVSNAVLVDEVFYAVIFAAQSVWYSLALVGYAESLREAGQPLIAIPPRKRAA
jgi:cellulose synthase/poly-beta-1,6-N-acetylglucosamine synthase-like glycosyltransferase